MEQTYYKQKYSDGVDAQHERNRIAGHSHRDRTTDDIRLNKKTCPEETLFIDIAKKYGIEIIEEPLYGGWEYLEKQDYILAQQAEKLAQQEQRLDEVALKISEAEALIDEVANVAYEKACEVVCKDE